MGVVPSKRKVGNRRAGSCRESIQVRQAQGSWVAPVEVSESVTMSSSYIFSQHLHRTMDRWFSIPSAANMLIDIDRLFAKKLLIDLSYAYLY
jgi:hypothetical protein